MDDDIQLPPLPALGLDTVRKAEQIFNYARLAVLADRERRAKPDAKPVVHEARMSLADNGDWDWNGGANPRPGRINILIHWTADGRVWIDSERNRELAKELRRLYLAGASIHCVTAADALDGGAR